MSSLLSKIQGFLSYGQKPIPPDNYVPSNEFISRVNDTLGGKSVFSAGEKDKLRDKITAHSFWSTDLSELEPTGITNQVISIDGVPLTTIPLEKHPTLGNTQTQGIVGKTRDSIREFFSKPLL